MKIKNRNCYALIKRNFDLIFATIALIVFFPLMTIISVIIKVSSRGPIFIKQTRLGKNNKSFRLYRFRTMYINVSSEEQDNYLSQLINKKINNVNLGNIRGEELFKLSNDPRITPFGRFLRKTSLYELPTLFNVLRGDMSLVGPRAAFPFEYEYYNDTYKKRLNCTPGTTGLWQISGRSAMTFEEMIKLDLLYIDNQSIWLDLKILLKSFKVLFFHKGSY